MKKLHGKVNAHQENYRLTLDWSRFDTTLPAFLLNDVFDMLRGFISFNKMKCDDEIIEYTESKAREYERIFDWVQYNFIHTKIMLPDATTYQKHSGIPSGSFLTSIIGSISNMIMIETLLDRM